MESYLPVSRVLIKDFADLGIRTTDAVKAKAIALASKHSRPFVFVPSSQTSKEDLVRTIASKSRLSVCVLVPWIEQRGQALSA